MYARFVLGSVVGLVVACTNNDDIPAPQLAGLNPEHGVPGTVILLNGAHFCQTPHEDGDEPLLCPDSGGAVLFGVSPGSTASWSDLEIAVEVPGVAQGRIDVRVLVRGRSSNALAFDIE